jgi:hypothetical protein
MSALSRAARYLVAVLVLGIGAVHLQQYFAVYYHVIPVIGPLFLANFIVAVVLGLAILAPLERVARPLLLLLILAGIGFAVTTIVALQISESSTLFGFHEHGYRTLIWLSLGFECAAGGLGVLFLALEALGGDGARPRAAPTLPTGA